jgi:hypothetical protein
MSDRSERKRQNAGSAGYHWLSTAGRMRMEPNFEDLTPHIQPKTT